MKYKFNLEKWKKNHSLNDENKKLDYKIATFYFKKCKDYHLEFQEVFKEDELPKQIEISLSSAPIDFAKFYYSIDTNDCDIIDEKIITEEEYNFLKSIENLLGRKVTSLFCESPANQEYNFIHIECEDPNDDEMNCLTIKTKEFNYFTNHQYYFSREELFKGWEENEN